MDELRIRAYHIAKHYTRLWTEAEGEAAQAFQLDGKLKKMQDAVVAEETRADMSGQLQSLLSDPTVAHLFKRGREAFYRALVERLLRDHSTGLPRCPRCNWLLPTERTKQCSECGYDWHRPNSDQPQSSPSVGQPNG
jgi:hypothetical protein